VAALSFCAGVTAVKLGLCAHAASVLLAILSIEHSV
jgi:hypothetical protein